MGSQISLSLADRFYGSSAGFTLHRVPVSQRLFRSFATDRRRFLKRLGEAARDPYWHDFCRWLARFHFRAMVTPLPYNHPALCQPEDIARFQQHIRTCDMLYPGFSSDALALLDYVRQLVETGENPLLRSLLPVLRNLGWVAGMALAVRDSSLCDPLDALLKEHPLTRRLELVSVQQVRERGFSHLFITGPANWFPEHLFAAPRAPVIHVIHYDWTSGQPRLEPVFSAPQPDEAQQAEPEPESPDVEEELQPIPIDVSRYLYPAGFDGNPGAQAEPTEVNARLFFLEGQSGLFLESDSTTLVIDPDAVGSKRVVRKAATNVDPGMFLLVKQGGGGDYIVPVADSLMGELAASARATQRRWKQALRSLVTERGLQGTRIRLLECGGLRPNEWNIRNWMATSSIRPWAFEDLAAILLAAGQAELAEECWRTMAMIDAAHSKAGVLLRKQLLRQIAQTDLHRLRRNGQMEFTVEVSSEVRMVALRVNKVLPGPYRVPTSRLASPFDMEESDAWLA